MSELSCNQCPANSEPNQHQHHHHHHHQQQQQQQQYCMVCVGICTNNQPLLATKSSPTCASSSSVDSSEVSSASTRSSCIITNPTTDNTMNTTTKATNTINTTEADYTTMLNCSEQTDKQLTNCARCIQWLSIGCDTNEHTEQKHCLAHSNKHANWLHNNFCCTPCCCCACCNENAQLHKQQTCDTTVSTDCSMKNFNWKNCYCCASWSNEDFGSGGGGEDGDLHNVFGEQQTKCQQSVRYDLSDFLFFGCCC